MTINGSLNLTGSTQLSGASVTVAAAITGGQNLSVTTTDSDITQNGVWDVGQLDLRSSGAIHLDQQNTIQILGNVSSSGPISIQAANAMTVNGVVSSGPGSGGTVDLTGLTLNTSPQIGAGSIALHGGGADLVLNANVISFAPINFNSSHDIIVNSTLQTTGPSADITLTADSGNIGQGGIAINKSGILISSGNVVLIGSVLDKGPGAGKSIYIDPIGVTQISATGDLSLKSSGAAPPGAGISIIGNLKAGGRVTVVAPGPIYQEGSIDSPFPPSFSSPPTGPGVMAILPSIDPTLNPLNQQPLGQQGPPSIPLQIFPVSLTVPLNEKSIPLDQIIGFGNIAPPPPGSFAALSLSDATSDDSEGDLDKILSEGEKIMSFTSAANDSTLLTSEKVVSTGTILSFDPSGSQQPLPAIVTTQLNDSISPTSEKALSTLLTP